MMTNNKIHIAACFDKGYVMPTGVMMYSVCANNLDVDIDFHLVIDESVTDDDKKDLMDTISPFEGKKVFFYHLDSHFYTKFPLLNFQWITCATYYRIFLPEILPGSVDKVIYLDGDCIVRHPLTSLWDTNVSNYAVAAVFDAFEGLIANYNRLRYAPSFGYFNAGVLFINLDYWRKHGVVNSLTEYINRYPERIGMEDQDVLNAVLKDVRLSIHPKYNFQTYILKHDPQFYYWKYEHEVKETIADPIIIHYTSREKPWYVNMRDPNPYWHIFIKYQNLTKWKDVKIEKRPLKKKIRNFVSDFLRQINILPPLKSQYIKVPPLD